MADRTWKSDAIVIVDELGIVKSVQGAHILVIDTGPAMNGDQPFAYVAGPVQPNAGDVDDSLMARIENAIWPIRNDGIEAVREAIKAVMDDDD